MSDSPSMSYVRTLAQAWKDSKELKDMRTADDYYDGKHAILSRKRMTEDGSGNLVVLSDLPNNRVVDNVYHILVNQKRDYLFAKPFKLTSENETYNTLLDELVDDEFRELVADVAHDSINHGVAWVYPYINDDGEFACYRFKGTEVIPVWKDAFEKELDYAIRIYHTVEFDEDKQEEKVVEHLEIYTADSIEEYILDEDGLDVTYKYVDTKPHITINNKPYGWGKVPLIPFKYARNGKPLLNRVKSLQDALNSILSNFMNVLEEDPRSSIMVVLNYDGENRQQFKRDLSEFGVVFLSSMDGIPGDIKTLTVEANADNFKAIHKIIESRLYANGGGYEAKFDRMGNSPNQMNIQSMYSDIELDSNNAEMNFKTGFKRLLWFFTKYLDIIGKGDFTSEKVAVVFNRNILINESQKVVDLSLLQQILSAETILELLPYNIDVKRELERIAAEKRGDTPTKYDPVNDPNNPYNSWEHIRNAQLRASDKEKTEKEPKEETNEE